jgi:hypothetical protein
MESQQPMAKDFSISWLSIKQDEGRESQVS